MPDVTSREIGRFEESLKNLEHRVRNDRQVVNLLADKVEQLEDFVLALKSKFVAAVSIFAGLISIAAWILNKI